MRLLIADDDPVSARLLEATLQRLGHDVIRFDSGTGALEAILATDGPRLAILDWMMPGLDGPEVCRRVRERTSPYVYLVLLSARDRREDMLEGLEAGADEFLTKPVNAVELEARLRSGHRIIESEERLLAAQEALRIEASHDHVTGVWNRRMIFEQLAREARRATREQRALSVLMADLDRFKTVNDEYGHATGDAVLRETAARMRSALRDYDFLGRYGGEEFLALLPGCEGTDALAIAGRVRSRVSSMPVRHEGVNVTVTVSIGLATKRTDGDTAKSLVDAADAALYRAKANGRDRVESAGDPSTRPRAAKNRVLVVDDDELIRSQVRDTLERAGYQVRTAVDGTEAFRTLPGFDPHAIVMDVVMPGENGYRVCRSIKKLGEHGIDPAPKVLLLTGRRVDTEDGREDTLLRFSLADGMMYKPFDPENLIMRVDEMLGR